MKKLLLSLALAGTSLSLHAQCNATITPLGYTDICQGSSLNLKASPGTTYQWYLNGSAIPGATNDTLNVNAAGSYEVVIDSVGCVDTSAAQIVTLSTSVPPQPGSIAGPSSTCFNNTPTYVVSPVVGATAYVWSGFYTEDTTIMPSVTSSVYPTMGPTTISVAALNGCGSGPHAFTTVTVTGRPWIYGHYPGERDVADMMIRICPGVQYVLFAYAQASMDAYNTSPYSYQWCKNGIPLPGETGYEYTITQGGNYSVQLVTQDCGIIDMPKKVYQDLPNSITVSPAGPLSFCTGNVTPLTVSFDMTGVSDPINWSWARYPWKHLGSNINSVIPDSSGHYMVFVQSTHLVSNCAMSIPGNSVYVTVPPLLEITQIVDTLFATPGYNSYQWFESGVPLTGATSQSHVLTFDGIYSVEAVFSNGCIETSDTIDPNFLPPPPDDNNGGQQNTQTAKNISVYPNPVVGEFTLVALVPLEDKSAGISIMDVMGKVIYQKDVEVKDGRIEQKIQLADNIQRFGIIKVRSKGANRTLPFYKKE